MKERDKKCPKCGSWFIVGSYDVASVFEKRGSKFVRKRGVKLADFDWTCETCGHTWSSRICISGIRFRRGMSDRMRTLREFGARVTNA